MFSCAGIQPQLVVPLAQVATVWNSVRTLAQNAPAGYRRHLPSTAATKSKHHSADQNVQFASSITEGVRATLQELGLQSISKDISVETLAPFISAVTKKAENVPGQTSHWLESHVSGNTFFENKNGFPESALQTSNPSPIYLASMPRLTRGLLGVHQPFQRQLRGFKTRRSTRTVGFGQQKPEVDDTFSVSKYLKESVFDRTPQTKNRQSDKLKNMLSQHNGSSEVQDKIKVAFAEGYAANDKKDAESGSSPWPRRLMRFMWYGLLVWLILTIIQSYTALGGNVKINVLKGDRYEVNPEDINVTFDDVKGADEAKQELSDVVEFLREPEKFKALGAKLPKGVLLVGSPGIGKTLLARAVAGEAGVPFFHASGSEFDEIFVGTGAKRVRQLFDAAKVRAPCVVFIDEIDTVGAKRTSSQIHPYANQTINQLLSEMDGFTQNEGVIVLGATNRRDNLDKALLRPGRFDVEVRVFPPDFKGRRDILELYLRKVKVQKDLDLDVLARGTTGCTGADLENIVNQAALKAAMENAIEVTMEHLEFARDKILMGPAKKHKIPDDDTNLCTAYHEGGHTLVAYYTKDATPLHKVTIVPRGMSLGHTSMIPNKEMYNQTKSQLMAQMDVAMGGRVAEEMVYGPDKVTTGASSDFKTATAIATAMVKQMGMSEKVGVRVFEDDDADIGLSMVRINDVSPATAELVDSEIKRLLQESYDRAKTIIRNHQAEHKELARALMKYETLDAEEIKAVIEGKKIDRKALFPRKNLTGNPKNTTPSGHGHVLVS